MQSYLTRGTCAKQINFEVDDNNILTNVEFIGGCRGNLAGITKLAVGENIETLISKLKGIPCRGNTSCPDQLAQALEQYLAK